MQVDTAGWLLTTTVTPPATLLAGKTAHTLSNTLRYVILFVITLYYSYCNTL